MSVKIKTRFGVATINEGEWTGGAEPVLFTRQFTEAMLTDEVGYHPFLDLGIAELAIAELGGEIVEIKNAPKYVFEREY